MNRVMTPTAEKHALPNDRILVFSQDFDDGTMIGNRTSKDTMIERSTGTLVPHGRSGRQMRDFEGFADEEKVTDEEEADSTDNAESTIIRN